MATTSARAIAFWGRGLAGPNRRDPAPRLQGDRDPGRDVGRQPPPRHLGRGDPAQGVAAPGGSGTRWGASGRIVVREGATRSRSSSTTSIGCGVRGDEPSMPQAHQVHNRLSCPAPVRLRLGTPRRSVRPWIAWRMTLLRTCGDPATY